MFKTSTYGEITRFDLTQPVRGLGLYWTTCYQVGSLLIDSGCAHTASELLGALPEPPQLLVNSHTHEDHIGANGPLQRRWPELQIMAHPLGLPVLRDPRHTQPLQPYRRLYWGWPEPSQASPLEDGQIVESGRWRFQVIYTPGHSQDHICLYEPEEGWLFSGDLFVGGQDRALRGGYDIWGIIAALKRIAALPIKTLYPASARVRQEHPQAELRAKIDYLEDLGERVLALHASGYSERAITRRLMGKPMLVEKVTLGHFSRRRLVRAYLCQNEE